jgi:hypothetical protein
MGLVVSSHSQYAAVICNIGKVASRKDLVSKYSPSVSAPIGGNPIILSIVGNIISFELLTVGADSEESIGSAI